MLNSILFYLSLALIMVFFGWLAFKPEDKDKNQKH